MHEEELALGQHLVDHLVEQLAPKLESHGLVADAVEGVLAEVVEAHVEGHEDVLLALEVVVEGRLGHAQLFGDLSQARAVVALGQEEVEGRVENALAGGVGVVCLGLALGLSGLGELGGEGIVVGFVRGGACGGGCGRGGALVLLVVRAWLCGLSHIFSVSLLDDR